MVKLSDTHMTDKHETEIGLKVTKIFRLENLNPSSWYYFDTAKFVYACFTDKYNQNKRKKSKAPHIQKSTILRLLKIVSRSLDFESLTPDISNSAVRGSNQGQLIAKSI